MLRSVIYIHSWDSVVGVNLIITQDSSSTMSIHSSAIRLNGLFKWLLLREEASYPLPWYNVWNRTIERQGAIISTGCVSFTYRSEWSWRLAIWWTICLRISRLFPHLTRKQEIEEAGIRAKIFTAENHFHRLSEGASCHKGPMGRRRRAKFTSVRFNVKFTSQLNSH